LVPMDKFLDEQAEVMLNSQQSQRRETAAHVIRVFSFYPSLGMRKLLDSGDPEIRYYAVCALDGSPGEAGATYDYRVDKATGDDSSSYPYAFRKGRYADDAFIASRVTFWKNKLEHLEQSWRSTSKQAGGKYPPPCLYVDVRELALLEQTLRAAFSATNEPYFPGVK